MTAKVKLKKQNYYEGIAEGYARGYADALEFASNELSELIDKGSSPSYIAGLFWQEAKRVRETGEVTK